MAGSEPWLEDTLELVLTQEIFNDIDRCEDAAQRAESKTAARSFKVLRPPPADVERLQLELERFSPLQATARGLSDLNHIASTIAAGVKYFVTRDEPLLDFGHEILNRYGVRVLSPVDLITHIDQIEREHEYQPVVLEGSGLKAIRVDSSILEDATDTFLLHGEGRKEFRSLLSQFLSSPRTSTVTAARDEFEKLSVLITTQLQSNVYQIPVLRTCRHSRLGPTLVRFLIMQAIAKAVELCVDSIHVVDRGISAEVQSALVELGFIKNQFYWAKAVFRGFMNRSDLLQKLNAIGSVAFTDPALPSNEEIETLSWPAKLDDDSLPCYLVPIRSEWAEHFFDTALAIQRLPGMEVRRDLHLGIEAVYYTAARFALAAPGRILWYVSLGNEELGSKTVKATSRLREVVQDSPKELFKRFRRLGIYDWPQVLNAARGKLDTLLQALRFSHTERLLHSIDAKSLASYGVPPPYMAPRRIPADVYRHIYLDSKG